MPASDLFRRNTRGRIIGSFTLCRNGGRRGKRCVSLGWRIGAMAKATGKITNPPVRRQHQGKDCDALPPNRYSSRTWYYLHVSRQAAALSWGPKPTIKTVGGMFCIFVPAWDRQSGSCGSMETPESQSMSSPLINFAGRLLPRPERLRDQEHGWRTHLESNRVSGGVHCVGTLCGCGRCLGGERS